MDIQTEHRVGEGHGTEGFLRNSQMRCHGPSLFSWEQGGWLGADSKCRNWWIVTVQMSAALALGLSWRIGSDIP